MVDKMLIMLVSTTTFFLILNTNKIEASKFTENIIAVIWQPHSQDFIPNLNFPVLKNLNFHKRIYKLRSFKYLTKRSETTSLSHLVSHDWIL